MKLTVFKPFPLSILIYLITIGFAYSPLLAASLDLGKGERSPGNEVSIPITLSESKGIVATSVDISYDTSILRRPRAEIGKAAESAKKEIHASTPSRGVFRVGILGMNLKEVRDGEIATVTFDISPSASPGKTITLDNSPSASDAKGKAITISGRDGLVKIK